MRCVLVPNLGMVRMCEIMYTVTPPDKNEKENPSARCGMPAAAEVDFPGAPFLLDVCAIHTAQIHILCNSMHAPFKATEIKQTTLQTELKFP